MSWHINWQYVRSLRLQSSRIWQELVCNLSPMFQRSLLPAPSFREFLSPSRWMQPSSLIVVWKPQITHVSSYTLQDTILPSFPVCIKTHSLVLTVYLKVRSSLTTWNLVQTSCNYRHASLRLFNYSIITNTVWIQSYEMDMACYSTGNWQLTYFLPSSIPFPFTNWSYFALPGLT